MKHTKSLFLSVFIHSILFVTLFFGYETLHKILISSEKQEELLCVKLNSLEIKPEQKSKTKSKPKKHIQKKIKPKLKPKPTVKPKPKPKSKPVLETLAKESKVKKEQLKTKPQPVKPTTLPTPPKTESVPSKTYTQIYQDQYLQKIIVLLQENLYYPRRARKMGIEGRVFISFKLLINQNITDIKVLESTHDILSRAARRTLENLQGKLPQPNEDLTLKIPIIYKLN